MPAETQTPDSGARRRAAVALLAIAAFGALAIFATSHYISDTKLLFEEDPERALQRLGLALKSLAVLLAVLLFALAGWLYHLSRRARAVERFPPPGAWVIHETRLLTGEEARKKAGQGIVFSAVIALTGVFGAALIWYVTTSLTTP
ncbi:MAG: hypothetical protein GWN99_16565 [Gemmatimonadetes bacterium]|uniref:Uncharacterized protein n=1 Tax=Candidatus Kutchimonas denitrificans TaxID=3056748 RepID=A0AAE5CAA9_9BACT|nr:hypothetical protein [Gemmatimonadota bacterium]NIR74402.1 hypothetical protein [Candidatus Kutchimonas denitrificans]NIS02653.1 hypothetical protein [Gemmatimonadota bacterium]NIT68528.1 hypothetical protein [Gemmatimonadota bacterium]NIU52005.1 hypothetical protein [Gemmatimonadota bacterium]